MSLVSSLGLFYGLSEAAISILKRDRSGRSTARDRGSLPLIWIVVLVAVAGGIFVTLGRYALSPALIALALVLYCGGLALRWWAIATLGRYFTVTVSIQDDHKVVTGGPYAFVRHPSYTGALLVTLGLGVLFQSVPGLLVMFLPTVAVILRRIAIEEQALRAALGEDYARYAARVKALVPGIW